MLESFFTLKNYWLMDKPGNVLCTFMCPFAFVVLTEWFSHLSLISCVGGRKRVPLSPLSPSSTGNFGKRRSVVTSTGDGSTKNMCVTRLHY